MARIEHCLFPDDLLYDPEAQTWVRLENDGVSRVGVTSLVSALAGKLTSVRLRPAGTRVERGRSLGTLESVRSVGPIPSPVSGRILEPNPKAAARPKLVNDSPYEAGWIARMETSEPERDLAHLHHASRLSSQIRETIARLRVRCFAACPDVEMVEIGLECYAVLTHLNELLGRSPLGEVVHLVVDDPTAYVEMVRWRDDTGHELVDWRREGELYHFVVRKAR